MYFSIITKQSWKQLCFLTFILWFLYSACNFNQGTNNKKELIKFTGTAFSISYAGADIFDHGYVLNINGKTFVHDSLYLFKKSNSDTTWLPTKKYVVIKSENGRILYDYITPFAILMKINDNLANDTAVYFLDASKLLTKGELIINLKPSGVVEFSKNYPLRIQPINEK